MKKAILIILGLILLGFLTVAALGMYKFNYLANQPGYDADGNKINISQEVPNHDYAGLTEADAVALATINGVPFRVVMRDGAPQATTRDFRLGRINATVVDDQVVSYQVEGTEKTTYDQNSWKEIIPGSCLTYFDGCNTCNREPGSDVGACTRKACVAYEKPKCLSPNPDELMTAPDNGTKVSYECSEGNTFTISYGEHVTGDAIMKLEADQVMMSDTQERTAYLFSRVVAASGEKYESEDGRIFWAKGRTANVWNQDGDETPLYADCREVQ